MSTSRLTRLPRRSLPRTTARVIRRKSRKPTSTKTTTLRRTRMLTLRSMPARPLPPHLLRRLRPSPRLPSARQRSPQCARARSSVRVQLSRRLPLAKPVRPPMTTEMRSRTSRMKASGRRRRVRLRKIHCARASASRTPHSRRTFRDSPQALSTELIQLAPSLLQAARQPCARQEEEAQTRRRQDNVDRR